MSNTNIDTKPNTDNPDGSKNSSNNPEPLQSSEIPKLPIRSIHCPAQYSDLDLQEFGVNKDEGIPHMDSCFDYSHELLKIPKEFDEAKDSIRWISLTSYIRKKGQEEKLYADFDEENLKDLDMKIGYLNALSVMSWKKEYLERIFTLEKEGETGLTEMRAFKVNLNIGGVWTEYIIDDFVPVWIKGISEDEEKNFENMNFLYTSPVKDGIWLPLVEKAYAKAHGGYKKLENSQYKEAIKDVSGVPCITHIYHDEENREFDLEGRREEREFTYYGARENDELKEELFKEIEKSSKRGHLMTLCETVEPEKTGKSEDLGLESNVNYRINAVELEGDKMLEIINPKFNNDDYKGENIKESSTPGGIWIKWEDALKNFNTWNHSPARPEYEYNSVHIPLISEHFIQSIVKIGVQEPGPYVISVDQKGKNLYPKETYSYNKCTLTIGRIVEGGIEYIDHITTDKKRNTMLQIPCLEDGSYVALIDIEANKKNYVFETDFEGDLVHWRDIALNIYGGEYCRLDSLAMDPNRQMMYDYFLHRIWKNYARNKLIEEGSGSKEMEVTMLPSADDPEKEPEDIKIIVQIFELPHLSIYKLHNLADKHIQVGSLLKEKLPENLECYGPYEVNNQDPWAVVNAQSDDILVFKYNDKTEEVPDIEMNDKFEIVQSNAPNPQEYYGEDPYEFMVKLYTVQAGKTYPAVFFPVGEAGWLINNKDSHDMKRRAEAMKAGGIDGNNEGELLQSVVDVQSNNANGVRSGDTFATGGSGLPGNSGTGGSRELKLQEIMATLLLKLKAMI